MQGEEARQIHSKCCIPILPEKSIPTPLLGLCSHSDALSILANTVWQAINCYPLRRSGEEEAIVFHMSGRQKQKETLWTFSFSLPFFGADGSNRLPHGLSNPALHIPGTDLHSSHMLCITCDSGASVLVMLRSYNIKGIA